MPSTRSQRAQLADPLIAPKRKRGRSASITSIDTSTPAPRAAPKRKSTRSSRQASVASSVVSEDLEEDALVTTETVIVEIQETEPELQQVIAQDVMPPPKTKRTLRDRQFEEEVQRARAARLAAEAAIAAAAEEERRKKQEKSPQRQVAPQKSNARDSRSPSNQAQDNIREQDTEDVVVDSANEIQPRPESNPQVEPQATPRATNPGLLRRIFGGFASPWRTNTPIQPQQPPATQPVFRFGETQAQPTPINSNPSQQQPATQPVRKFREARGPSTQTKPKPRSEISRNTLRQTRQTDHASMEPTQQPARDNSAPQQIQESPTPAARQENKRKRAGSEPPPLDTITETPELHRTMATPSRPSSTNFYETPVLAQTAPRPHRVGLIPRPTPRRTIKSVREARSARQTSSSALLNPLPSWSSRTSTPSAPRDKNADRRLERLHEMQTLQQQQKEAAERLARLQAEEEADRPKRTKRVKVDELKWIPARRPGESTGTFRVPDFDSDDEIEVDEDEEMLDNPFDLANAPEPTPVVPKPSSAPTNSTPSLPPKSLFPPPPQSQTPSQAQMSLFAQPPQQQAKPAVPLPTVQAVPDLIPDADDPTSAFGSEDDYEGWPEMPLAAPAWAFTEKETAEGLAMFEAGLAEVGGI